MTYCINPIAKLSGAQMLYVHVAWSTDSPTRVTASSASAIDSVAPNFTDLSTWVCFNEKWDFFYVKSLTNVGV